ncbi:ATP-dependent helicase [Roseateles chitinivorans]|uniref:ATP-dependent helicase n=1 Tax=Roseateles chitinivorans TaxID=2917965 RepID=UPI003D66DC8B
MSDTVAYRRLVAEIEGNPGQKAAYESRDHCVVLAGPGSGKTKTLVAKVARLLLEEVREPRGVACITYNNECSRELAQRLADIGFEPSRRLFVGTVHSFSLTQIVLPYAKTARIEIPDDVAVATRDQRQSALTSAVQSVGGSFGNFSKLESQMNSYRRAHLRRDTEAWKQSDRRLAQLCEAYERELRSNGLIDFDDMPLLAWQALRRNPWLRKAIVAKYPVLVIDEYQDLGLPLHKIATGLCFHAGMRIFAVGDVDQSIYGFTGAQPQLLEGLAEREDVQTVHLTMNYRSGRRIVDAAGVALGVQRGYEPRTDAALGEVFVHPLVGNLEAQAHHLFSVLLPAVMNRNPRLQLGDIAVLYSAAWVGNLVADAARSAGLSTVRCDANAPYPRSSRLMQWLELCAQWCCGGWRTGTPRLSSIASQAFSLLAECLPSSAEEAALQHRLVAALWYMRDEQMQLHEWLDHQRAAFLASCLSACPSTRDDEDTLAAFAERCAPGGDLNHLRLRDLAGAGASVDQVTLSTLHSAKGREFSVVFMFGMNDGVLPWRNADAAQISESRRTFYVGFTRAKAEVHLLHTRGDASPFVDEVARHLAR